MLCISLVEGIDTRQRGNSHLTAGGGEVDPSYPV